MIVLSSKGRFTRMERFLNKMIKGDVFTRLEHYAIRGKEALASATPVDSGKTASSWNYEIHRSKGQYEIIWTNSNVNKGVNIAVILQYGHGTRNGGYVVGRDYINPAMRPVFDDIANRAWEEVVKA